MVHNCHFLLMANHKPCLMIKHGNYPPFFCWCLHTIKSNSRILTHLIASCQVEPDRVWVTQAALSAFILVHVLTVTRDSEMVYTYCKAGMYCLQWMTCHCRWMREMVVGPCLSSHCPAFALACYASVEKIKKS